MELNSKKIQAAMKEFHADEIMYVGVGVSKYDNVFQVVQSKDKEAQTVQQAMPDLSHAVEDLYDMKKCLQRYNVSFREPEPNQGSLPTARKHKYLDSNGQFANCIILADEKLEIINKLFMSLTKYLREQGRKGKKILIFFLFAGHGMTRDNGQVLLTNDLDKNQKYYKMFKAEAMLRNLAASQQNAYAVSIFACCRQRFDPPVMCVCFDKTKATEIRQEINAQKQIQNKQAQTTLGDDLSEHDQETLEFVEQNQRDTDSAGYGPKSRGTTGHQALDQQSNLILCWGCQPTATVLADTRMVHDFFDTLRERFDRKTLSVTFPDCLDDMLANEDDEKWEVWRSNKIQKCKIFYRQNKITHFKGVIVCNTHTNNKWQSLEGQEKEDKLRELAIPMAMQNQGKTEEQANQWYDSLTESQKEFQEQGILGKTVWANAEQRCQTAVQVMEMLGFRDPDILKNCSRDQIHEKMEELQRMALNFEEEYSGQDKLAIFIIYIGNRIQRDFGMHKKVYDHFKIADTLREPGAYQPWFEISVDGQPMNLNEWTTRIADTRASNRYQAQKAVEKQKGLLEKDLVFSSRTHVMLMDDFAGQPGVMFTHHIDSSPEDFAALETLKGQDRAGRNNTMFFPFANVDILHSFFKKQLEIECNFVQFFPEFQYGLPGVTRSVDRWPTTKQSFFIDFRPKEIFSYDEMATPYKSLSDKDFFYGGKLSQGQLLVHSETLPAHFMPCIHFLQKQNKVVHVKGVTPMEEQNNPLSGQYDVIYQSSPRIVLEFYTPDMTLITNLQKCYNIKDGKEELRHCPIQIEKSQYETVSFVVEDHEQDDSESFLLIVMGNAAREIAPRLIKIVRDGAYWKTYGKRLSDLSKIKGLDWSYLKQNAMAETDSQRRGDWWGGFVEKVETDQEGKQLLSDLKLAQLDISEKKFEEWKVAYEQKSQQEKASIDFDKERLKIFSLPLSWGSEDKILFNQGTENNLVNHDSHTELISKPLKLSKPQTCQNAFIFQKKVIVLMSSSILVYNYNDLSELPKIIFRDKIQASAQFFVEMKPCIEQTQPGHLQFWLTSTGSKVDQDFVSLPHKAAYNGNTKGYDKHISRIVKVTWNIADDTFTSDDQNAIHLCQEYLCGFLEYAPDCFIISCLNKVNLLKAEKITHQPKQAEYYQFKVIQGPKELNKKMKSIQMMQGFDKGKWPFVIATGLKGVWIVNIQTCSAQELIKASPDPHGGSNAVVYHKPSEREFKCLISTQQKGQRNKEENMIHEITLFSDFKDVLLRLGFIPEVSVEHTIELELENRDLRAKIKELQKQLEASMEAENQILRKVVSISSTSSEIDNMRK